MKVYCYHLAIAADQLLNALLGGCADETLSSRAWRMDAKPRPKLRWQLARRLIDALFFWQRGHCRGAYEMERLRRHLPKGFEGDA